MLDDVLNAVLNPFLLCFQTCSNWFLIHHLMETETIYEHNIDLTTLVLSWYVEISNKW